MSDQQPKFKAPRSIQEIQAEYSQVLQRSGQCQYQVEVLKKDLTMFNASLRDLSAEAFAANEAAQKAKAETDAKAKAETDAKADVDAQMPTTSFVEKEEG